MPSGSIFLPTLTDSVPNLLALELFGRTLPTPGFGVAAAVFMVVFFLMSRNGGLNAGGSAGGRPVGRGRMYQCDRCGTSFQPEKVELLSNGQTRSLHDERCPNCGWDIDWREPNKKTGGSSGTW